MEYAITGDDYVEYLITDKGDPLVAKIEPPTNKDEYDLRFKIVGMGNGATAFKIVWESSTRRMGCRVKVTVNE